MRTFIKSNVYHGTVFRKLYQGERWKFTNRIKYQLAGDGEMVISFEVVMFDDKEEEEKNEPIWYSSCWFGFDDSSDAVIYDCSKK